MDSTTWGGGIRISLGALLFCHFPSTRPSSWAALRPVLGFRPQRRLRAVFRGRSEHQSPQTKEVIAEPQLEAPEKSGSQEAQ